MSNTKYSVDYFCDNCGYEGPIDFLYGQLAPPKTFCIRCGLEQANKIPFKRNISTFNTQIAEEKPETD